MHLLDLTLSRPAEDLALDEELLSLGERGQLDDEVLRLWDAQQTFVVLGRSGQTQRELHLDACQADDVPVLRRSSGGGTVVAARGCMFFSLVLSLERRPGLRMIDTAHQYVMQSVQRALSSELPRLNVSGSCDLTLDGRKVSGNSMRIRRNWLLYHGTLLLDMDISLMKRYLRHPPREPDYRDGRPHEDFVANLNLDRSTIAGLLTEHFAASAWIPKRLLQQARQLAIEKYDTESWNLSR